MPDIGDRYIIVSKELFLKREDAEELIDHPSHLGKPPPRQAQTCGATK